MGNLTKDPELRYTPAGMAVANLRLAVNRKYRTKDQELKEEVCFITAVVWSKQAETCNQYLHKGSSLFDDQGRLRNIHFFTQIQSQNYSYFSFQKNNMLYGIGYDYIDYRKYMHSKVAYLLFTMICVSFLYLLIFPVLFYVGLIIPLNNLMAGVQKVDNGNLEVAIPIQFMDEIGFISGLFNKMVISIKDKNKILDEYAYNLEEKVIERTKELEKERHLLSEKNKIIENDLILAKKIQMGLIPKCSPVSFISSLYKPMEQVGGDFYDFIQLRDANKIGIFICDVSGHGVHAAFITSMIKTTILQSGERKENPAELLSYINDFLQKQTAGNFITAFYCIFNRENNLLTYSSAGHPQPFIITKTNIEQLPNVNSPALAIFNNDFLSQRNKVYHNFEKILPANSKLLMYTDGFTEARPVGKNIFFEDTKMMYVFYENRHTSSKIFISKLYERLIFFRGEESFEDDICIICLEVV